MFELKKWYFDCIDSDNNSLIGYAAKLKLGFIRLNYGAVIRCTKNGVCEQKQTFSFGNIEHAEDSLTWENGALNIRGTWSGKNTGSEETLYDGKEGSIKWKCIMPAARVNIQYLDHSIEGNGYVEQLTLSVPPWKLPFDELRWGRFISDDNSRYCIWIDWKGNVQKNWVWTGEGTLSGKINAVQIDFGKDKIVFHDPTGIRSGSITDTLFGKGKILSRLLPKGMRNIQEFKFTCRGELFTEDRSEQNGNAIFEVVSWI